MQLSYVSPYKSIRESVSAIELSDLIVLSGPNGSGKSHLLEAIENGAVLVNGVAPSPANVVRRFVANALVTAPEAAQTPDTYRDTWVSLQQAVQLPFPGHRGRPIPGEPYDPVTQLEDRLIASKQLSRATIDRLKAESGKTLRDFAADDFRLYAPLLIGVRDPFHLSLTELFLSYHNKRVRHRFSQFLHHIGEVDATPLSDEAFLKRFGSPPWDLFNDTLRRIGLDYAVVPPQGYEGNVPYEATLRQSDTGAVVPPSELSSGEKTLLAVSRGGATRAVITLA